MQIFSEVAERYSVPLIAQGARTAAYEPGSQQKGSILIRFDPMRHAWFPSDPEEPWVNTLMGGEGQSVFKKRVCPKYVVEIDFRSFISRSHMTAKSQGLRTHSC